MTAGSAAATRLVVQASDIDTPTLKALAKLAGAERIEAMSRGTDQAFALTPAHSTRETAAYCAQAALDCALVPGDQRRAVAIDQLAPAQHPEGPVDPGDQPADGRIAAAIGS